MTKHPEALIHVDRMEVQPVIGRPIGSQEYAPLVLLNTIGLQVSDEPPVPANLALTPEQVVKLVPALSDALVALAGYSPDGTGETDPRPLTARVDAYVANLQSIASQLTEVRDLARDRGAELSTLEELSSGIKLYGLIADDLTKIVNGEKLSEFRVEGTLP